MRVDSVSTPVIGDPIAALEQLSARCEAPSIAADLHRLRREIAHRATSPTQLSRCLLRLCARLRHHLAERWYALDRPDHENLARCNSLVVARVLAHAVVELHDQNLQQAPDELSRWLATERTKFLMATRVDALAALAGADPERIAAQVLEPFARRVFAGADRSLAKISANLLVELATLLGELAEVVPFDALASFELTIGTTAVLAPLAPIEPIEPRETAAATLLAQLELGSHALIHRVLAGHETARYALAGRLLALLDSALESLQLATDVADAVTSAGCDAMARERARIVAWTADLTDIVANLA